jgi:Rps23 Pro-64 3,4-dihydroxylase Tpa1-like proline 4-hydroxylase
MSKITGLEIYDLNFDFDIDLSIFNKKENLDKIENINEHHRKVKTISMKDYDPELLKKIQKEVSKCLEHYKNKYLVEINSHEDFLFLEYTEGGHFDSHFDDDGYGERALSMTLYLNDDYEGGELEFTHFKEITNKIKPKKNQLFLFQSLLFKKK